MVHVLMGNGEDIHGHRHTKQRPHDRGARDRGEASTIQGMLRIAGGHQKVGRGRKDSSLEPPSEQGPADT